MWPSQSTAVTTRCDRWHGAIGIRHATTCRAVDRVRIPTGEVTELLQQLIRNECVNDGTHESGHEMRSADLLRDLPRRHAASTSRRYEPQPGRASLVARDRGQRPDRADAAADGPHRRRAGEPRRLAARSVRRRARRRRGVGPRRGRHAQPHRVDGGGVPRASPTSGFRPAGHARSTSPSPTRRRSAPGAPSYLVEHERDAVRADYVHHRVRRLPDPDARRAASCR